MQHSLSFSDKLAYLSIIHHCKEKSGQYIHIENIYYTQRQNKGNDDETFTLGDDKLFNYHTAMFSAVHMMTEKRSGMITTI